MDSCKLTYIGTQKPTKLRQDRMATVQHCDSFQLLQYYEKGFQESDRDQLVD